MIAEIDNLAKLCIIIIIFNDSSNVQKTGEVMRQHCQSVLVEHGDEHVVSLIVETFIMMPCFREVSKFCKCVSRAGSCSLTFHSTSFK